MLKLLERNAASVEQRLVLVAPPQAMIPGLFKNVEVDSVRHARLVGQMQEVRGGIYLDGGYLKPQQLSSEGLHQTPEDEKSWHLLMTDEHGHVSSCAWYLEHANTTSIGNLRVRSCPLARVAEWKDRLYSAVESEIAQARGAGLRYAEVGGWAVSKERRCSSEGLVLALAAYGLCRALGGAIGITTANVTHASSSILRRLGGSYLEAAGVTLPAYFDPRYNTMIELLRFDSRRPSLKYGFLVDLLQSRLAAVPVVVRPQATWRAQPQFFERARPQYQATLSGPLVAA
jgi:hypothetical protein